MVKIITDTTASLLPGFAVRHNIPIVPQVINFGTDSYLEGKEISLDGFMARLKREKELPKTAAPPPELFASLFRELAPQGEPILCIHPSAEVSGTVRSATVAAIDFEADIRVIDTRVISSPLATMVELAATWAADGVGVDTIETRLKAMIPRWRAYFLVSTLEYLARGGRIGGASALLGSVLRIKPILQLQDGRVEPFEKERTHRRALLRLKSIVLDRCPRRDSAYLSVMHAGVPEQAHALAGELRSQLELSAVPVYDLPPAIVTHAGPGLLGVAFQEG